MCAQRLSASEVEEPVEDCKMSCATASAQRLSASEVEELHAWLGNQKDRLVLNAFRHQRLKNANCKDVIDIANKCSTPFGIRG